MERIKLALERARQQRQDVGPGTPLPRRSGAVPDSGKIQYLHTKTVKVSMAHLREQRVIAGLEPGPFIDAYKILRTQVLQRLRENDWNTLAVTSPHKGNGKSLTAINLAISLAMEVSYTVLLVDADLRRPTMHDYFGITPELGLSDYLTDHKPLNELLIHPEPIDSLVILPGGRPLINSAEMLSSPMMTKLVEELKQRYPSRIIMFDLPPVLAAADSLGFAPYVDATLLVVEESKTKADELKRTVELLETTNLIGTVLSKSREPDDAHRYY